MQVDVWSDVVCPWCYIGKRRLESALAGFADRDGVTVVFHAFELDPTSPKVAESNLDEMLARKYGMSKQRVAELQQQVTRTAAADGLDFHLERARPENTFDAHRLIALAKAHGLQAQVKEALMKAYFVDGGRVGDAPTLRSIAVGAGLPADAVDAVLADPSRHADEVRADERQARELGIRGVPFFVVDGKYGISGAQPAEVLRGALTKAWSERPVEVAAGVACEGEVCLPGDGPTG
jgi:predicted DsbA family dithiol-disulfide isomerase